MVAQMSTNSASQVKFKVLGDKHELGEFEPRDRARLHPRCASWSPRWSCGSRAVLSSEQKFIAFSAPSSSPISMHTMGDIAGSWAHHQPKTRNICSPKWTDFFQMRYRPISAIMHAQVDASMPLRGGHAHLAWKYAGYKTGETSSWPGMDTTRSWYSRWP